MTEAPTEFRLITEPLGLQGISAVPCSSLLSQSFYLGYGRNAWNNTWVNIYQPNSVSFDADTLKERAEKQRVQGTVFKIQSVPMLIIKAQSEKYGQLVFGVLPINEGASNAYTNLLSRLHEGPLSNFFIKFPSSAQNWLLTFSILTNRRPPIAFQPSLCGSFSRGSGHRLGWSDKPVKESYEQFLRFAEAINAHFAVEK